ncbi:MAG TPA: lipocalin-like domain-containing protein [Casimicrobiaceae bacterium]|nr:lipocalin-like domain-containing protein [Casimicrobiaceae bacterium]
MKRRNFLASPLALLSAPASAADEYPEVTAGQMLRFPRDFGSHPIFRNEWWYITGWVREPDGVASGIQVTFFRNRPRIAEDNSSRFAPKQLLFVHVAVADPRHGRLRHDQRAARAGFGLADASEGTTAVWIDDWSLKMNGVAYVARISARDLSLDLRFTSTQGVLAQGEEGYSRKGPAARQASYYYSEPQLAVSGRVATPDRDAEVTGIAWLDHEWSSEPLAPGASGWDWVGLNLDDGGALMAFRIRDRFGATVWAGGTYRSGSGSVSTFERGEIGFAAERHWRSPRTQAEYPVAMAVRAGRLQLAIEPLMDDQELDARAGTGTVYWEGAVRAIDSGREVGRGYLELTGYWKPLKL